MRISLPKVITTVALLVGGCWGCGSGSGALPALIPVKGKVSFKGQPVTKGVVRFEPDGYGRGASGHLQPDGSYVLTTLKEGDGVVAGHHKICITETAAPKAKDLIPKKYASPNSSTLTADVDTEHTEFNFELRDGR
jgi:hypothetical protein